MFAGIATILQRAERERRSAQFAGDVNEISDSRSGSLQRCEGFAEDGRCYRKLIGGTQVSSDDFRASALQRIADAVGEIEQAISPRFGETDGHQDTGWTSSHGGKVAQRGRDRAIPDLA